LNLNRRLRKELKPKIYFLFARNQAVSILQRAIDYMQRNKRTQDVVQLKGYLEILEFKKSNSPQKDKPSM